MSQQEPIKLDQVLKQLVAKSPYKDKLQGATIVCAWYQVMPPIITQRTEQIFFKQNKLFLKISSSPLRQEIQNAKSQVLAQLKEAVPEVEIWDLVWL